MDKEFDKDFKEYAGQTGGSDTKKVKRQSDRTIGLDRGKKV